MTQAEFQDDPLLRAIADFRAELDRVIDSEQARLARSSGNSSPGAPRLSDTSQGPLRSSRLLADDPWRSPKATPQARPVGPEHSATEVVVKKELSADLASRNRSGPGLNFLAKQDALPEEMDAGQRLDALAKRLQGQAKRTQRPELPSD